MPTTPTQPATTATTAPAIAPATVPDTAPATAPGLPAALSPAQLKTWLHDGEEIALLDVQEHGQFGEGHLFYATPLPYSRLELDIHRLVPRKSTRTVLYDDGESGIARQAQQILISLGYTHTTLLAGGLKAWSAAGYACFKGVNLPSKTFGELVEHTLHTPSITATELARRQATGEPLLILDGRPYSEYLNMHIPGAHCCPNGELALRIGQLAPDPATPIIIHCAGRTRSIIGAQTLRNMGIPNPVMALQDGTQGWYLADLPLAKGPDAAIGQHPHYDPTQPPRLPPDLPQRQQQARLLAERHGVRWISAETAQSWLHDPHPKRTTFVLDIRTAAEFQNGTLPGARHAPGGQLLQATDHYAGVRHARLLILDHENVRAPVVASWLRQMGHDAHVLQGGIHAPLHLEATETAPLPALPALTPQQLARELQTRHITLLDLRPSMAFRAAHIPGALWSIRPRLFRSGFLSALSPTVLIADDPGIAQIVAHDLLQQGYPMPHLLQGSLPAWQQADLPTNSSTNTPPDADCIDYLFFVHDRHHGNKDAARQYLAWETGLLAQIDEQERTGFRIG